MPDTGDFQVIFWQTVADQIRLLPFFILQLVGVMGVFTVTLIAFRGKAKYATRQVPYGLVFGVTGYVMTGLVADFLGTTFKPYIRHELTFLAALFGGWPGGLLAGALTFIARIQFGGTPLWLLSLLDTLVFVAAGALLHAWAIRRDVLSVQLKDVLWIATVKTGVGLLSIYVIHRAWPASITAPLLLTFLISRITMLPLFFGSVYGLLLIMKIDAQRQRYQQMQLQQMESRLQASVQREQLLLGISHCLKTPLTRLRLRLELLTDEPLKQDFEADVSALDGMVMTALNTLRSPDGQEECTPTRLDLLIRHLVAEPIYLNTRIDTQLDPITLDLRPKSMACALGNLIDNGILYGQQLAVNLQQQQNSVCLTIRDFGPGIAQDDLHKVFQPHTRLDYAQHMNANGTGLGLGISRNVIRAHGGEITLRNHPEGGLEVQVQLPMKTPLNVDLPLPPSHSHHAPLSSGHPFS